MFPDTSALSDESVLDFNKNYLTLPSSSLLFHISILYYEDKFIFKKSGQKKSVL